MEPVAGDGYYLDTFCRITIYSMKDNAHMTDGEAEEIISSAFEVCEEYEDLLSKTRETSDIYKVNNSQGEAVEFDQRTIDLLKDSINYGYFSEGSFNITMGDLVDLWDFHSNTPKKPSDEEIEEAMSHIAPMTRDEECPIIINESKVSLRDPEMHLDLGGIAKGYIGDRMAEHLVEKGVTGAVIDLGGNVVAIGFKDGEKATSPIRVGVKLPYTLMNEIVGAIEVHDACVVTSGVYERYLEVEGVRYHHILSPETGYPAETELDSATVVGPLGSSKDCDALATTIIIKGEDWLREKLESPGVDPEIGIDPGEFTYVLIRNDGTIETMGSDAYVFRQSQ